MIVAWMESYSGAATEADAERWAGQYGATFPFLADPSGVMFTAFESDNYIPSFSILAPGLELVVKDNMNAANQIEQYLPY